MGIKVSILVTCPTVAGHPYLSLSERSTPQSARAPPTRAPKTARTPSTLTAPAALVAVAATEADDAETLLLDMLLAALLDTLLAMLLPAEETGSELLKKGAFE